MTEKYEILSIEDHVRMKDMWGGSLSKIHISDMMGLTAENKLIEITATHAPIVLKIIDEIIVNATDHSKGTSSVSKIEVSFSEIDGSVVIFNDGHGIPVECQSVEGRSEPMYIPEIIFANLLSGSNMIKNKDNVKGGTNGIGAKLANLSSSKFTVETVDSKNKKKFVQQFENRFRVKGVPVITKCTEKSFTRISFTPAYSEFEYGEQISQKDLLDLSNWCRYRTNIASVYLNGSVLVTYNSLPSACRTVVDLAKLIATNENTDINYDHMKSKTCPHLWHVAISLNATAKRAKMFSNIAIVNGVISPQGPHLEHVKQILKESVIKKLIKSKIDPKQKRILDGVQFVLSTTIPCASWNSQLKNALTVKKEQLNWTFSTKFLSEISDKIFKQVIISDTKKPQKVVHEKYTKANFSDKINKKDHTYLMAAEGDSALSLLRSGLTQTRQSVPPGGPSFDWCGMISLQGVIVNAAKEITELSADDGSTITIKSSKLKNNKRLMALYDAFGLDESKKYESKEELDTLKYGKLILCVDQDLDGTGKIASLVLVWIYSSWPNLIKQGRVGKLMTPLIRAYPNKGPNKKIPIEFYYESHFNHWMSTTSPSEYSIKYYKGLASHDKDEVKTMFTQEKFKKSIYIYKYDESMDRLFKVYFGKDPALRREALMTPVQHLHVEEASVLERDQSIPVGRVQLDIDTKSFKNEAIRRQLPHIIDGLNPVRRKIIMGAFSKFKNKKEFIRVFQLGGYIADVMYYHHGDTTLNETITRMAQSFAGARRYPYLTGKGIFGDRHGTKAGQPRYIDVQLSAIAKYIFPPDDKLFLPYVFEDGKQAEPLYFIPILPMAVLESYEIVTEGWTHCSFGQKLEDVLKIVYAYLDGNTTLHAEAAHLRTTGKFKLDGFEYLYPLTVAHSEYKGELRKIGKTWVSFGEYIYDTSKNTILITDLPMGVQTDSYIEQIRKSREDLIDSIDNKSSTNSVELIIKLRPNAIESIEKSYPGTAFIDSIENCFMLRTALNSSLNYYSPEGGVLEFKDSYLSAILYWAPVRKELYITRVKYEVAILKLKIREELNILRFISLEHEIHISNRPDEEFVVNILTERKFDKIDVGILYSKPELIPFEKLESVIVSSPSASYDYLLNLRARDLTINAAKKREQKIQSLKDKVDELDKCLLERPVPCASIWKREIKGFLDKLSDSSK